jgi:hypothetical protein
VNIITAMLWVCRECGTEVSAASDVLVSSIGWTGLDGDTGLCSLCGRKQREAPRTDNVVVLRSKEKYERTQRALAVTRLMIDRARRERARPSTRPATLPPRGKS